MDALPAELLFLVADHLPLADRLSFRAVFPRVFTLRDALQPFAAVRQDLLVKWLTGGPSDMAATLECLCDHLGLTAQDVCSGTALNFCAQHGHVAVLEGMHRLFGLSAAHARAGNNEALRAAARQGHVGVLECLREGFGLTAEDARAHDNEALRAAAKGGHLAILQYLRKGFGLTPQDARSKHNYAIRMAARGGHLAVVKYLREGFGLTAQDARTRGKPLRWAIRVGSVAVLDYLREGFGLGRDDVSTAAIIESLRRGRVGVVRCLCERYRLRGEDVAPHFFSAAGGVTEYVLRWFNAPKHVGPPRARGVHGESAGRVLSLRHPQGRHPRAV